MKNITLLCLFSLLLQGCSGIRYSYKNVLTESGNKEVIHIKSGEEVELFAESKGFPGSWGYIPHVISSTPAIASITCKEARSIIPFREPGILFGGTVCHMKAHQVGSTTLYFGNLFNVSPELYHTKVEVKVSQ